MIIQPLGLILAVFLIWRLMGWACLVGVLTVVIAQMVNAIIARVLLQWERTRRHATDNKLQMISQFVEAIRHLRWYGWQDSWLGHIMEARQHELNLRVVTSLWSAMISFVNTFASGMFPVAAFYAYTILAGKPLRIDIAFPAIQLFTMLETNLRLLPNLITAMLNATVAIQRIEDFMGEPDKEDTSDHLNQDSQLRLANASFRWPGATQPVLRDISLTFPIGLTVICGKVGTGKSALLQALLGELDTISGEHDRPDEMLAYCAQTPWLQSMSIRDNILFSSPYEEKRYKKVLEACALDKDMVNFKHGDLSHIGENGIGLSGGQRARVALARAVYSRARFLLLDDPLSALDHQTAEVIVQKCLGGSLMERRTIILVTHRTEICVGLAKQLIEISDGTSHLRDMKEVHDDIVPLSSVPEDDDAAEVDDEDSDDTPDKFLEDEHRALGGVKAAVYWEYIKAGKLKWWFALVLTLALYRLILIGQTWFLKQWGEAYNEQQESSASGFFDRLPSPEIDVRPWLLGFFIIAAAQAFMFLISQGFMLVIIYSAGKQMFRDVMAHVSHATFRFYDITPIGRLMNRLTSDISTIDGNISLLFQDVATYGIAWVSSLAVIASVTPPFLFFAILMTIGFVLVFLRFLPSSQSLRRLEVSFERFIEIRIEVAN